MVLRQKLSRYVLFFLAACALTAPTAALAGEWHHRGHDGGRYYQDENQYSPNGLPTHIKGLGTFVGGISGVRVRGVGNYFYIQPSVANQVPVILRPKATVIPGTNGATCSMENGVCVLRGN
jgi:hypothetical protein